MARGSVRELWRYPVKSLRGEPLETAALAPDGLAGDRAYAFHERRKGALRPLTVREAPRMLAWAASYDVADPDSADPPPAVLTGPGGHRWTTGDAGLGAELSADLGRDGFELRRAPGEQHDLPGSLLVTTEASLAALAQELGTEIDVRRFRPNLHLELDAPAFAEERWEGGSLEFEGGVVLRLLHPCERCVIPTRHPDHGAERWPELLKWLDAHHATLFGINAQVVTPGVVRRGERVAAAAP
jgi:MOSC domain-containing protein